MKKIILALITIFMVVSCTKTVKGNENDLKTASKASILLSLPESIEVIVNIKSIKSVFDNFLIKDKSALGKELKYGDLERFENLRKILTINPLNLKDLESIGIDTNKELGIAFSNIVIESKGNNGSVNIIAYLPLKDSVKLLSFIENRFKDGKLKNNEKSEINYKKEKNYIKISGKEKKDFLYVFVKNNYLFIITNELQPESALKLTNNIINSKTSLKNSPIFKETVNLSEINKGFYFYGNINNIIKSNEKIIKEELGNHSNTETIVDIIKSYKSISGSISLDTKEFLLNFSAFINKDSKYLSSIKDIKYNNSTILGLDKSALFLTSFGINVKDYLKLALSLVNERDKKNYDKKINKLNIEYGIDIQKDIINNLDGNFSLGVYDGMSISTTNYNAVKSIGFKDVKLVKNFIDELLANPKLKQVSGFVNKTTYNEKEIYIINAMVTQIYIGFKGNEMIIASSKNIFDDANNSKTENGFYKHSKKDEFLSKSTKSDMIFYVSFLEAIKALNNFKAIKPKKIQATIDALELLDYFLISGDTDNSKMSTSIILKTFSKESFFPAVIEYVNKNIK